MTNRPDRANRAAPNPLTPIPIAVTSELKLPLAEIEAYHRSQNRSETRDKARLVVEIVALLAFAATGYFAYGNLATLTTQTKILTEQVHDGQRAYLLDDEAQLDAVPLPDKQTALKVWFKNSGQTPAESVRFEADMDFGGDKIPASVRDYAHNQYLLNVGAGQRFHSDFGFTLTKQQLEGAANRTLKVSVFGTLTYMDVFGGHDHTNFCFVYTGTTELLFCDSHHEIQ